MIDVPHESYQQATLKGIARARSHAQALDPEWTKTAIVLLQSYAYTRSMMTFTSEDFRCWASARGLPIPVPKALGHTFRTVAKQGHITKAGFSVAKDRHGSPTVLWRAK